MKFSNLSVETIITRLHDACGTVAINSCHDGTWIVTTPRMVKAGTTLREACELVYTSVSDRYSSMPPR